MDFNNIEHLKIAKDFTFRITEDCPSDFFGDSFIKNCNRESDCAICWRIALTERIKQLEQEQE